MYNKGQLVYIYYNDLEASLLAMKEVLYSRFGYITEISSYTQNNEVHNIYTVKTVTGANFNIDQSKDLKLCLYDELVSSIVSIKDKVSEQQYNAMLHMLELNKH